VQLAKENVESHERVFSLIMERNAAGIGLLSEDRAEIIKQLFIDLGIDASRIDTYGTGENNLVADNTTEAGRSQNRRTEIHFVHAPVN